MFNLILGANNLHYGLGKSESRSNILKSSIQWKLEWKRHTKTRLSVLVYKKPRVLTCCSSGGSWLRANPALADSCSLTWLGLSRCRHEQQNPVCKQPASARGLTQSGQFDLRGRTDQQVKDNDLKYQRVEINRLFLKYFGFHSFHTFQCHTRKVGWCFEKIFRKIF